MALPIAGGWAAANANANQYVGALKWGTGVNPVHGIYGEGPPIRTTGRIDGPDNPTDPLSDIDENLEGEMYGYTMEDIGTTNYYGMTPAVGTTPNMLRDSNKFGHPNWGDIPEDPSVTAFRTEPEMDKALWSQYDLNSFPTETVSEGWLNKETGKVNPAEVSDPVQYERQTSMQQVNPPEGRNNSAAQVRATDDPRASILTRLTGMKIKPWSQGQRNADMFPYQQDLMLRPFWYRTAGTDNPAKMGPNEMTVVLPVQRDVPPDPYLGPEETAVESNNYGYTPDDFSYIY
jgi:hypothetical protein